MLPKIDSTETKTVFYNIDCEKGVTIKTTNAIDWEEVLQTFEEFLRGCGYIIDGHFELVQSEEEENK